jgi:hypothetical protein
MSDSKMACLAFVLSVGCPSLAFADFSAHQPAASRLTLLALNDDGPGCTKDTDCKGSRVCNRGKCEEGSSAPSAAGAVQPAAPSGGYGAPQGSSTYRLMEINQKLKVLYDNAPGYGLAITGIVLGSIFTVGGVVLALFVSTLIGVLVGVTGLLLLTLGIIGAVVSSSESTRRDREIRDLENERMLLLQRSSAPPPQGLLIASF